MSTAHKRIRNQPHLGKAITQRPIPRRPAIPVSKRISLPHRQPDEATEDESSEAEETE